MKIDDLLALAGSHPLSSYEWGVSAVLLLNQVMPPDLKLAVDHTGLEARDRVRRLPSNTLVYLLTREVELNGSVVEFSVTPVPLHGTPPTAQQENRRRMSPVAIGLMILLGVIGLALTFSTVKTTSETGQAPDTEALRHVISTLSTMVKDEREAEERARSEDAKDEPAP